MKVLDLKCAQGHAFEGWFASQSDFDDQRERQLIACPVCGELQVERQLSAPRIALNRSAEPAPSAASAPAATATGASRAPADPRAARMMEMARELLARTEDVGDRFVEEARRMHYGETEHRHIRGTASVDEAVALVEEGVPVMAIDLPEALKERLH